MATTAEARKKAIEDFKAKSASKKIDPKLGGGTAHAATPQEAAALATAPTPPTPEPVAPEPEPVPDKQFVYLETIMGGLDCYTVAMTMKDILDYTCYAEDLYDVETGDGGKGDVDPSKTWQRVLNEHRASKEISPYLQQTLHFFPPLVCVIASERVSVADGKINIDEKGLAVLDGQHRRAGIAATLALPGNGPDSDFAKESMPIVILGTQVGIEERQQIFSDVNRSAKVVSKALNILFDHRDIYAVIAQAVAQELPEDVDLTRTVPTAKSSHVASLSNIYNLIHNFASSDPKHHARPMRNVLQFIRDVHLSITFPFPIDAWVSNKV